jgi:hypothetical protein
MPDISRRFLLAPYISRHRVLKLCQSEIFAARHAGFPPQSSSGKLYPSSAFGTFSYRMGEGFLPFPRAKDTTPSGRHIPLLTELETLFDFGCCNYAATDGTENESQRDSNPSAQGWRSAPAGEERLPWENVPKIHQLRRS